MPLLCFIYVSLFTIGNFFTPILFFRAEATSQSPQSQLPAPNSYACILSDTSFFYSAPNETSGVFLLPKTYYVKLLSYGADYCKIEYQTNDGGYRNLIGYAKTQALTFVSYTPSRPYFSYVFEISYRLDDVNQATSDFLNQITFDCAYYGDYTVGSTTYCYVLRGEEFGYVPKPADVPAEENTEYTDYLATLTPTPPEPEPPETLPDTPSSPAQIAILIALCLLVPLLAALILKPPRRPPYEADD